MRNIAEFNLLMRAQVELPVGLRVATDVFREGWNLTRSLCIQKLEAKIVSRGWSFIRIDGEALRSGVGETSQLAIASALTLALRHMSELSNAAQVEHIELTTYPWFFLARVHVYPYRIQQSASMPICSDAAPLPIRPRQRRLSPQAAALFPHFGSAMPQLKQMLVSSRPWQSPPQ